MHLTGIVSVIRIRRMGVGFTYMKLITDYFYDTVNKASSKVAFVDQATEITYKELYNSSRQIASTIVHVRKYRQAVAILMKDGVSLLEAELGVVISGNFYSAINPSQPPKRIREMLEVLEPAIIITEAAFQGKVEEIITKSSEWTGKNTPEILIFEDIKKLPVEEDLLLSVRSKMTENDLLYVTFTSGSTGIPKAVAVTHRNALFFARLDSWLLGISEESVIANFFSVFFVAVSFVVYSTIICGATCVFSEKLLIDQKKLQKAMADYNVNTISCTPGAISLLQKGKTTGECDYRNIKKVYVAGGSATIKDAKTWQDTFPDAKLYTGFGMSELGGGYSHLFDAGKWFSENHPDITGNIPMGKAVDGIESFIVRNDGNMAETNETGELYIRFSAQTNGYYRDFDRSTCLLVQNPLENRFKDIVLRTGDLACRDEQGYFFHKGRIDFMIKRHGIRIELGDIDSSAVRCGAHESRSVFLKDLEKIVTFYSGDVTEKDLYKELHEALPAQSMPDRIVKVEAFPINQNGKTDFEVLRKEAKELFD